MPLDFNDLIPTAVKEKPKLKGEKGGEHPLGFNDLINISATPSSTAMDFEDLVPKDHRFAFPKAKPEILEVAKRVVAGERTPEKTIPSVTLGEIAVAKPKKRPTVFLPPTEYLRTREGPEVLKEIERRKAKPIGIREQAGRISWAERIPFSLAGVVKSGELASAVSRLREGGYEKYAEAQAKRWPTVAIEAAPTSEQLKAKDRKLVEDFLIKANEEAERRLTFGAKVLTGASILPAWMVEFMFTGGLKTLGSETAKKAGTKLLGRYAKTKAGQLALKGAGWIGGAAARTTVGMPHRVGEEILKRRIPPAMHFGPKDEFVVGIKPESWATSIAKGWGNVFIEAASEEAGATITKGLGAAVNKLPFGKRFLANLRKVWTKLSPDNTAKKFWRQIFSKGGYSNIIGEIGEERLATIMHAVAKTQDFGAGKDANVFERLAAGFTQDVKNFPVEATVLSMPAAARFGLTKAVPRVPGAAVAEKRTRIAPEPRIEAEPTTTVPEIAEKGADYAIIAKRNLRAEVEKKWKDNPEVLDLVKKVDQVYTKPAEDLKENDTVRMTLGWIYNRLKKEHPHLLTEFPNIVAEIIDDAYPELLQQLRQNNAPALAEYVKKRAEESGEDYGALFVFGPWTPIKHAARDFMNKEHLRGIGRPHRLRHGYSKLGEQLWYKARSMMQTWPKEVTALGDLKPVDIGPEGRIIPSEQLPGGQAGVEYPLELYYLGKRHTRPISGVQRSPRMYPVLEDRTIGLLTSRQTSPLPEDAVKKMLDLLGEANRLGQNPFAYVYKNMPEYWSSIAKAWNDSRLFFHEAAGEQSILERWPTWKEQQARIQVIGVGKPKLTIIGDVPGVDEADIKIMRKSPYYINRTEVIYRKTSHEPSPLQNQANLGDKLYGKAKEKNIEFAAAERVYRHEGRIRIETFADGLDRRGTLAHARGHIGLRYVRAASPELYSKIQSWYAERLKQGHTSRPLAELFARQYSLEAQGLRTLLPRDAIEFINELNTKDIPNAIHQKMIAEWDHPDFSVQKKPPETEEPPKLIPPIAPTKKDAIDFEDLVPATEPKHISKVVVDTFREWPSQIPKVGKDYWIELMATAKRLLTPYRYKALRQTMLGVFRFRKRPVAEVVGIELQDVRDALSATHELGHNIDWLLNKKTFPSSIKARFADPDAKEMTLRKELHAISKILRPDMWERPKAYIKRHTELMADFISHYILDPEKTRELAPNVTSAFEAKLAEKPELFDVISRLQESRYAGPEEPPIAKHIREAFPLPKEFTPLQLIVDMTDKDYVKAAEELGITAVRHYKLLMERARRDAARIDSLVPSKARQTDLVVIAEKGTANPWTGKTLREILAEGLKPNEQKAIKLFRGYQELARQTVNKYLRGADIAEYIKFIEDYFLHAYQTPMTEKYKTAISKWAKRSPQAKKRVLPDLAKAVELGLKPRAKTLSDGLVLWAGINYRVAVNKAFLRILPQVTNDDGISILQKPQDFPAWPTVDYWPIRQTYAVPLPNRGVLLFQGRVAVDPRVKPFIDAMFGRRAFNTPVRIIEGFNAIAKAFELTLFSLFHHQAEFFSAVGALGPRAMPYVGGYYGKRAQAFGKKPKLWGFLPAHIPILKAGKQLEKTPEFMEDYLAHGGQTGYISTEGINLIERMLKNAAEYLENMIQTKPTTPFTGVFAAAYVPVKTAQAAYSFHQQVLWDNVQRAKLVAYYNIVADGAKYSDLPMKRVKETAVKYLADNFGGQEWLNTMFRKPKVRQFWTQLMMSLDWTWSQIKTARWPFAYGGKTKTEIARRALMRKIGRHHWFWYLAAIAGFTIAGNYGMNGKGPWENERGHKLDIDWTNLWRKLPWNRDWKKRGDYNRRYIGLGKAGRELVRWVTHPLRAFGYKLSPGARTVFEQTTGYNIGSDFPEPWAREDLEFYQEIYARFGNVMEKFKPFAFSGNNAFLAFPSRKGMTHWKAIRSFEELFDVKANIASGGLRAKLTKASHILDRDKEKLVRDIIEACELNNVDWEKTLRAGLSNVRSKYYGRFWNAAKAQDRDRCNRYADALVALGINEEGFTQSLTERASRLSKESAKLGIDVFLEKQKAK